MNAQLKPAPGDARSPAVSAHDVLSNDRHAPPPQLLEQSYRFLGDDDVAYSRYTLQAFFDAEMAHMWKRVWQMACREQAVREPGDFVVYDIGNESVIVVRTASGAIKAYYNSCLHRGTQLKNPGTTGWSKSLRCPFHGWEWSLDGELVDQPCEWDFPHLQARDCKLPEVRVATWGGNVFINFDERAPSLEEYLGVLPGHFANWDFAEKFVAVHIRKKLNANWKACIEAFLESYHVLETHPQGLSTVGDANSQYDIFGDHVSRFVHLLGIQSPHIKKPCTEQEMLGRLLAEGVVDGVRQQKQAIELPPGQTAREAFAAHIKSTMGAAYRRNLDGLSTSETIDALQYFVFPNVFFFPSVLFPIIYRFRPDGTDPDRSIFDLMYIQPTPENGPRPDDAEPVDISAEQSYREAGTLDPGLADVYDQDTGNLAAQQRGFKSSRKRGQTLGNYQEIRVRHLHHTLDRYLAGEI